MIINLNDTVKVKLTAVGLQYLIDTDSIYLKISNYNKKTGWITTQLWQLMQEFGGAIYMGCHAPFEKNDIELIED